MHLLRRKPPRPPVRMTTFLSDEVATTLAAIATRRGVSVTEVIRSSIATEMWRQKVERKGGVVLVESASGDVHVVTWPYATPHAKPTHCTT